MDAPISLMRGDARTSPTVPTTAADPARAGRPTPAGPAGAAKQAAMLVLALAVTVPLASLTVLWTSHHTKDLNRGVFFAPFDLVLAAAVLWVVVHRRAVADLFRAPAVAAVSGAYVLLFGVSFAMHPSWLGVSLALHLAAGLAVIAVVGVACSTPDTRRIVLATVTAVGVAEAVLAIAQSAHGGPLGIAYLDFQGPLYQFGTSFAGRGGFTHPYHLDVLLVAAEGAAVLGYRAACAASARNRWAWVAAAFVIGGGLGVSYSRTALIGQAVVVAAALLSRDRRALLPFAAAVLVGLTITGAAFGNGWVARGGTSTDSSHFDSGRRQRMEESLILLRSNPAVGVGPGRYNDALSHTSHDSHLPSHDLLLQEGAELGVLGYGVAAAFLGLLAIRAWRGGAWSVVVIAPMVPFILLDSYAYVGDSGLALSALWLGLARLSLGTTGGAAPRGADPSAPAAQVDAEAPAALG